MEGGGLRSWKAAARASVEEQMCFMHSGINGKGVFPMNLNVPWPSTFFSWRQGEMLLAFALLQSAVVFAVASTGELEGERQSSSVSRLCAGGGGGG